MRAYLINEKFEDETDPIRDMGIGLKPEEVLDKFTIDLRDLGFNFYTEEVGYDYNAEHDEIYTFVFKTNISESPLDKLFFDTDYYELIFATTNRAAEHVISGSKWGFFYWNQGKIYYLKNAKDIKSVFKHICKIRKNNSISLTEFIKKFEKQLNNAKKIKNMIDES